MSECIFWVKEQRLRRMRVSLFSQRLHTGTPLVPDIPDRASVSSLLPVIYRIQNKAAKRHHMKLISRDFALQLL